MQHFPHYPHNILLENLQQRFAAQLGDGQLAQTQAYLLKHPEDLSALVALMRKEQLPMHVRVGISAIMEAFTGKTALITVIAQLGALTQNTPAHIRGDACYFLGLTQHRDAKAYLEAACQDAHVQVREAAVEALELLADLMP